MSGDVSCQKVGLSIQSVRGNWGIYYENALYTHLKLVDSVSFADMLGDQHGSIHTCRQSTHIHKVQKYKK